MARIRNKTKSIKIDGKPDANRGCCSDQYPWLSFRYLTRNSKYNLDGLPAGKDREIILCNLNRKLAEISGKPWLFWTQNRKSTGLENLTYGDLEFSADPESPISKDTTVFVFRFDTNNGTGRGRIIGFKNSPCAVFHIIGYDLDFSAYDHGS